MMIIMIKLIIIIYMNRSKIYNDNLLYKWYKYLMNNNIVYIYYTIKYMD